MDAPPLILSLALDEVSFRHFDDMRRRHFPPERNVIPAHLTLFHHLPGDRRPEIEAALRSACQVTAPFEALVADLFPLGRGVAYRIEAEALKALRGELARRFAPSLTPQDRQPFRPHITIQNKVAPETARDLLLALRTDFRPWQIRAEGLLLWAYRNGPWERLASIPFTAAPNHEE